MANNIKKDFEDVARESLQSELERTREPEQARRQVRELNAQESAELAKKIGALPPELKNILYFHYCLGFSPKDAGEMLNKEQASEKLAYAVRMLSVFMGLGEDVIGDVSMKKACEEAMDQEEALEDCPAQMRPRYTKAFRRTLREIPAAQKKRTRIGTIARRAVMVAVAATLCGSIAFASNGSLRGMLVSWFVETTQEYSKFQMFKEKTAESNTSLEDFDIGYIPNGYELSDVISKDWVKIYQYKNSDKGYLDIEFKAGDVVSYVDTENAEVEEVDFKGNIAYQWGKDALNYMVWQQNGVVCYIMGNVSMEEISNIAQKIEKK